MKKTGEGHRARNLDQFHPAKGVMGELIVLGLLMDFLQVHFMRPFNMISLSLYSFSGRKMRQERGGRISVRDWA
jgi:hypothetical protein